MEEILKLIIENLVDNKEAVSITSEDKDGITTFKVKVSKDDMGKVIGKQGKIAHSIRTLMRSVAGKEQKKVDIEFVDE
jgi:predicted RNA-binding protein YlqC (UPF0109 family)